jgi:hypothetical protein
LSQIVANNRAVFDILTFTTVVPISAIPTKLLPPAPVIPTMPVPTLPSASTSPPTNNGTTPSSVRLAAYALLYEIDQTRIPSLQDYNELALVTKDYIKTYYNSVFANSAEVKYTTADTSIAGTVFRLGQPVNVDYNTTINFDVGASTFIPTTSDLDAILLSAFTGPNNATYLAIIQTALQNTNIFSTTRAVGILQQTSSAPPSSNSTTTNTGSPTSPTTLSPATVPVSFAPTIAPNTTATTRSAVSSNATTISAITVGASIFLLLGVLAARHRQTKKGKDVDKGKTASSTRDRPYIKIIDDSNSIPSIVENRTLSTSCSRSEMTTRSFVPNAQCDEQSFQAIWESAILDNDDDDEDHDKEDVVNEGDVDESEAETVVHKTGSSKPNEVSSLTSTWVSTRINDDGPFDGIDLDDTTTASDSSTASQGHIESGYERSSSNQSITRENDS